jgi:hypothetical protein
LDGLHPPFLAFSSFPGVPELQRVAVTGTRKYPPGVEPFGWNPMAGWVSQQNGLGLIKNEHLVGGIPTPLKNISYEKKKCSKPPTRT